VKGGCTASPYNLQTQQRHKLRSVHLKIVQLLLLLLLRQQTQAKLWRSTTWQRRHRLRQRSYATACSSVSATITAAAPQET
jgi:hypothetical protein